MHVSSYRLALTIFALPFFFLIPTTSHAASTCTDTYSKDAVVPQGYGAAYNLFSAAKELLVKTSSCTDTSAQITVGNGDTGMYVYKNGYYWNGSNWTLFALRSDSELVSGNWYLGTATYALPLISGTTYRYYVGYTCQKVSDVWKCGCSNTTCSTAAWQLQRVTKTSSGSSGPVCGNGVCESGENTSSCSQDCKAAGSANVIINYASAASPGVLNHVALGLLHGLEDALSNKISPASLWTDLSMNFLRTRPGSIAQVYTEDKRLRGGSTDATMVITLSGTWGYATNPNVTPPWGSDYNNPNYSAWLNYVVTQVNRMKVAVPDANKRIYDLWNEPNGDFWWKPAGTNEGTTYSHFKEMYRLTYKLLKEGLPGYNGGVALDPNARFTAPGTAVGLNNLTEKFTTGFIQYAKDNNVVPDLWNWHFGDPITLQVFNRYMDYAASIGAARDALILEYLREQDGKRPGRVIYEFAMLESATHASDGKRIIGAAFADWPTTGEAGNGLFYSGSWRKHGMWYAFANYAKMTGAEAPFTSVTSPKIGAVASIDAGSKKAWALLGNDVIDQRTNPNDSSTIADTTIRLDNIRSADASGKVTVTVSRIPYDNFGEVTDAEVVKVINNTEYTVTGNSVSVAIPWGLAVDGYFIEVSNVLPR